MRILWPLSCLWLLASCQGVGGLKPIDGKAFLSSLEGPKVPTVDDTRLEAARHFEKQGNFRAAEQSYRQILDKTPGHPEAMLGLAEAYRRQGSNEQALAIYNALLETQPSSIGAKEGKALALLSGGDFDSPIPLLEEVLRADPKRWKALNGMGILFTTRNMQPEAQQYFREALKHNPTGASIMNNLGLSQALDRKLDLALSTLAQASALTAPESPERKRIDLNMALVHAISGRLENARAIASQYFSGATLSNNMGLYAHLAKDDQLSKSYLNMALSQSKTFYDKAWENLQAINSSSGGKLPMPVTQSATPRPTPDHTLKLPDTSPAPEKKTEPPVKAAAPEPASRAETTQSEMRRKKEEIDNQILGIIGRTGEESDDIVQPSPIP